MRHVSKTSRTSLPSNDFTEPLHARKGPLQDFAGQWHLHRQIIQSSGGIFVFEGQATFRWCGARLNYEEIGLVTAPDGRQLPAERKYSWAEGLDNQVDVFFEDGRFFHSFSRRMPQAEHLCGDDHYMVDYTFSQWPEWESCWRVTGPRKDYTMVSRYQPVR